MATISKRIYPPIIPRFLHALALSVFAKLSSTGSSIRHRLLKYRGSSNMTTSTKAAEAQGGMLPKVPKGNLPTLLSFIGGSSSERINKSQSQQNITVTQAVNIQTTPYSELRSIDVDYHSYLDPKGLQNTDTQGSGSLPASRGRQ
ncbi:hypothetical protein HJFPF1_09511 [Paramyrothecium foliicola]|nr:hypothetical protein HJFPF1_09511 [Paramyrothecium foliicola]